MSFEGLNCVMCDTECSNTKTRVANSVAVNAFFYCVASKFLKLKEPKIARNFKKYGNPEDWPELKVCMPCRKKLGALSLAFLFQSMQDEKNNDGDLYSYLTAFYNSLRNSKDEPVPCASSSKPSSSKHSVEVEENKSLTRMLGFFNSLSEKSKEEMENATQFDKSIYAGARIEQDIEILKVVNAQESYDCKEGILDRKIKIETKYSNYGHSSSKIKVLKDSSVQVGEMPAQSTQTDNEELKAIKNKMGHPKSATNQGHLHNIPGIYGRPMDTFIQPVDQLHKHGACEHDLNSYISVRTGSGFPGILSSTLPNPLPQHGPHLCRRCETSHVHHHHHPHVSGPAVTTPCSNLGIPKHHPISPLKHHGSHHPSGCTQQVPHVYINHCHPQQPTDQRNHLETHHGHPSSAYGVSEPPMSSNVHHNAINCNSMCNQPQNCSQSQPVDLYDEYTKWQAASTVPPGPSEGHSPVNRQNNLSAPAPCLPQEHLAPKPHGINSGDLSRRQFSSLWENNQENRTQQSDDSILQQTSEEFLDLLEATSPEGRDSNTLQLHSSQPNFTGILKSPEMQSNLIQRPCAPLPILETNTAESLKTPAIPEETNLPVDSLIQSKTPE